MEGRSRYLSHTSIVISNTIPFYEKDAVNNSIGRRLVVYHMTKSPGALRPLDRSKITNAVLLKFLGLCLAVARPYEHPPTSLAMALYTVFCKNVNRITAGLVYDPASTRLQMVGAIGTLSVRRGVSVERLWATFYAISPSLTRLPRDGSPYILSLRGMRRTVTEHELNVISKRQTANVISLEALLERTYWPRSERQSRFKSHTPPPAASCARRRP